MLAIILCCLGLICYALVSASPVELHQIKSTGIIFEKIGSAAVYRDHWTIVTQIQIPEWEHILDFLEDCEDSIRTLCEKLKDRPGESNCVHWDNEIVRRTFKIREKIDEAKLFSRSEFLRKRRGLINVGGTISKFLFGTMDHEDSEKIYQKLEELDSTNQQHINIAKHQITLIKTTTDIISETVTNLTKQQNSLIKRTNQFSSLVLDTLHNQTNEIRHVHIKTEINEIALFVLNELQKIFEHLTNMFFILESLNRRELSPLLIPAKDFESLYISVTTDYHREKLNTDFSAVKVATKVDSQTLNDKILVKIRLPLLENYHLAVNKIYVIPVSINNKTFSILDINTNYLLNGTQSSKNLEISEARFQTNCIMCNDTFFVCKTEEPVLIAPSKSSCVLDLFRQPNLESPICEYRVLSHTNNMLIPMKHDNSWLYWIRNKVPLFCQCPHREFTKLLSGTGIFKLLEPCTFRILDYIIPFKRNVIHELSFHQPDIILPPKLEKYKLSLTETKQNVSFEKVDILDPMLLHTRLKDNSKALHTLESEISQAEIGSKTVQLHFRLNIVTILGGLFILAVSTLIIGKLCWNLHKKKPESAQVESNTSRVSIPIIIPRREQLIPEENIAETHQSP